MGRKRSLDTAAVVTAAAAIADEIGLDALTLAAVAERLDIKVPSLYNHVGGLRGLRRELALAGVRATIDALRRSVVGLAGTEAVTALALAYRTFAQARPGLYAASVRAPDAEDTELQAAADELLELVLIVLRPFNLPPTQALHTVRALRAIVHGFVDLERAGGFGMPLEVEASFRLLVEHFVLGLNIELRE